MKVRGLVIAILGIAVAAGAAPVKRYAVRISVKGELEKVRDSSKNESEKKSTKTKTEKQHYDLKITLANTGKHEGTFDLEWYFFKRRLDDKGGKGDPVVCEKNKTTLTIGGMKRVMHPVKSGGLSWSESKSSSGGNNKNSGKSSSNKNISGDVYGGYVVLVRADGEIVAKYSDEKKFLTDEWLGKLNAPADNSRSSGNSSKKKKKKKKK